MSTHSPQSDEINSLLEQLNAAFEQYTQALCKAYEAGAYTLAIKDATLALNTLSESIEKAPDLQALEDKTQNLINNDILLSTDARFPVINHLLTKLNLREQEFIKLVSEIQDQQDNLLNVVQVYYTSGSSQQYADLVLHNTRQFLYSMEEGLLLPLT
jgi:hypothetical protein